MSSAKPPDGGLPTWMPPDAKDQWVYLNSAVQQYSSLHFVRDMLQRLGHRLEMKDAWVELKRFEDVSPRYLVMLTFVTWVSAMRSLPPMGKGIELAVSKTPRELAQCARAVYDAIRVLDPTIRAEQGMTQVTLVELARVARFLEGEVNLIIDMIDFAPLPRKVRAGNAAQVTFVNQMCSCLLRPTGLRRPYSLVATLTNVTFDVSETKDWDAVRVRKCYDSRSRTNKKVGEH